MTEAVRRSDPLTLPDALTRRRFLRTAVVAGGGLVAASVAACAPAAAPGWMQATAPAVIPPAATPTAPVSTPSMGHSMPPATTAPGSSPAGSIPPGWAIHDVEAKAKVDRVLAGEWNQLPGAGNQPLEPRLDGDVKVFDLTIDEIRHQIDATKEPLDALGCNGTWPGPILLVTEGDRVPAIFRNNLRGTTGVHFHGQDLPNAMDGVPLVTQDPIVPGATFAYEFVAGPFGSHMYHSHHNATDQVGRGLLGAFLVTRPTRPNARPRNTARPRTSSGSATTSWADSRSTAAVFRPRRQSSRSWASGSRSGS